MLPTTTRVLALCATHYEGSSSPPNSSTSVASRDVEGHHVTAAVLAPRRTAGRGRSVAECQLLKKGTSVHTLRFMSFNAALASAQPGDTITVPPGLHPGPFRISGVTLEAAPGATLLGPIVLLSGTTLDGLTVMGAPAPRPRPQTAGSQRRQQTSSSLVPLVDIQSGSSTLVGCRIDGTVRVGPGSTAQIRRNLISSAVGPGVELIGTADGCEVSENTIEALGGAGIVVRRQARALLSSNRVLGSGGAGIEVVARAASKVIQNTVHDGRGQGVLVHDGASAELLDNDIRRNFSSAVELSGEGTSAVLSGNTLRDGQSGVGLLIHHRAHAVVTDNDIGGHPIANVEVGDGSAPTLERNVLEGSRGVGLLLAPGAAGVYRRNTVRLNGRAGIECCSAELEGLLLESNNISQQRGGVGALLLHGGAGRWHDNRLAGNAVGMQLGKGAAPNVLRSDMCENRKMGLELRPGSAGCVRDCHIHNNGHDRLAAGGRRGARTAGDDSGAGVVMRSTSATEVVQNQIGLNAGAGVFAESFSQGHVSQNVLKDNCGAAISSRPGSACRARGNLDGDRCPLEPTVVRRQRVPFDWTVGSNITAHDKTLQDRVGEMRSSYLAMKDDGPVGMMALMPEGSGASEACCVM